MKISFAMFLCLVLVLHPIFAMPVPSSIDGKRSPTSSGIAGGGSGEALSYTLGAVAVAGLLYAYYLKNDDNPDNDNDAYWFLVPIVTIYVLDVVLE